jgi:ribosome-associated protein
MDDLRVTEEVVIPGNELTWRFDPSGGPGGQHANRSSTRVELLFDVTESVALDGAMKTRVLRRKGVELGVIRIRVSESRSQWKNRQVARQRLAEFLAEALQPPAARRKRTFPGRAARERRLAKKRARSETKRLRRPPEPE